MFLNEKETDSFGAERNLHYICGANGLAAIYVTTADKDTMYYAFTDYQHNLLALTDAAGKPYERYSYDPWGNRRSATDWTVSDTLQSHIVDRGYTLHEHLDEFGLINMNGRMYDPKLACFLSPDPVISDAGNWLDYNRYSYAWGNPLKYCDPTGMEEATDMERTSKIYVDNLLYDPLRDQKDKKNFDLSDIFNLKEGHYENSNGELIKTDDLKKFDNASDNTAYNTGTSTTKNTSAEQQQNKMTVTTPNDLNKPQDSGNLTEEMTGTDKWMEKNRKEDWGMDVVAPVAKSAVNYFTPVGLINDVVTLSEGEDLYGNEADVVDYVVSFIDIATIGIAKKVIPVGKYVYRCVNSLNTGGSVYSSGKIIYNEMK